MNPRRKNRMFLAIAILIGMAVTISLVLYALRSNIDLFYTPGEIVYGKGESKTKPEAGQRLRIGGMVMPGSVVRDPDSLKVSFKVYDARAAIDVRYEGILPDLFREDQSVVAQGVYGEDNVVNAKEVLAKHDENYMPPEVEEAMKGNHQRPPESYQKEAEAMGESEMIPELGNFALALATGLALLLSIYPLLGAYRQDLKMMAAARPLAYGLLAMALLAFGCLVYAFIFNDFSVIYVAANSNSQLPVYFRMAAVWGAHEGSLLLWIVLLSLWTGAVAAFSRQMPLEAVARVLSVLGMINVGFLLFVILTSNPFLRALPMIPIDGRDLNPLLQDVGLIFHPPLLYMGYVGFSVAFAFAISSLMAGKLDTAWARWSRPWTTAARVFLTLGIALGSYWAYYELGWGGWWFWDPVENASLMPWITGTALLHSLAVTEKRGSFKAWTVLMAIVSFSLCLLGTFLVRSGILVSVHSFASDPARGMFILAFLVVVIGGSLLLYAINGSQVRKTRAHHEFFSRESFLLGNNILLMAAMMVVLLGTLLPLVHKQLGLGSISVGAPFFDTMFIWLMVPFSLLLGIAPLVRWRRDEPSNLLKRLVIALVITLAASFILPWWLQDKIIAMTVLGLMMAVWVIALTLMELHERATHRHGFLKGLTQLSRSHWGMSLAHLGVAVTVFGIAFSQNYSVERDVRLKDGDSVMIRDYTFTFRDVRDIQGPNYTGGAGELEITRNGKPEATLHAEKRYYKVAGSMMTEAAIDGGITRDLYAALGEQLGDGAWAVRIYYKPFVRWIWFGGLFMAFGGLLCILDPRYRTKKHPTREETV